jgi:predicted nucleic acid-binding protein
MLVVSNTSPLLNLAIIGRLGLIEDQFERVFVAPAVLRELRAHEDLPGSRLLEKAISSGWIQQKQIVEDPSLHLLSRELHRGEAETIVLAVQSKADWVLMDEREGRKCAKSLGLRVTGVLGILLRAKQESRISSFKEVVEELSEQAGFRIAAALIDRLLRECGEKGS